MIQFAYTREAWKSSARDPNFRWDSVGALAEKLGGRMIGAYLCIDEWDGMILLECPDNAAAEAVMVTVIGNSTHSHFKGFKLTVLMRPEEATRALRKLLEAAP